MAVFVDELYSTVPVVVGHFGVAFHNISYGIDPAELSPGKEVGASAFRAENAMAYRLVFRGDRTRLIIIVDEVAHHGEVSSVGSPVKPVKYHVVDEVKHPSPTN